MFPKHLNTAFAAVAIVVAGTALAPAQDVVQVGLGSYATRLPAGAKGPPETVYRTADLAGPMPTNDWWSSVAWMPLSERQYPHPLAVRAEGEGLRVHYPGSRITANKHAIFGFMPAGGGADLVLGHSAAGPFPDARVAGHSDWFVRVRFGKPGAGMTVSYGHGSPFVYARYEGGAARLTFPAPPKIWAGTDNSAVLGITAGGNHYGLFGPTGSTWSGLSGKVWGNHPGKKRYFSLAVLPEASPRALKLFATCAHSHVTDTKVMWQYDPAAATVTTRYALETKAHEPGGPGALFALYPHQWRHVTGKTRPLPDGLGYDSVRGRMKLATGTEFVTQVKFPGVLPCLPAVAGCDKNKMREYLQAELPKANPPVKDTYWEGKHLGKLATLSALAELHGQKDTRAQLLRVLRARLEGWLTASGPGGKLKSRGLFHYDRRWGTLIGYPASYASDTDLNDHHFHYGYFLRAAAEVARNDPAWARPGRWGGMLKLLADDVACPRRDDARLPFLRNFDPYAGHSWASGHAKFGDGNNNESSSEAMNAWCALILLGEAGGDRALRDLGVYLFTTEMTAIHEYWFDVRDENHPKDYPPSVVTMIWGGKGANGTWFSANPEAVHGINFLPVHGGSLYLGHHVDYVRKNYRAMERENGGAAWDQWADIVWMYRALSDPAEALARFAAAKTYPAEAGNSKANTYHWLCALRELGHVDPTVQADTPLYAVFRQGDRRSHVAWNLSAKPVTVTFSDGASLRVEPGRLGNMPPPR